MSLREPGWRFLAVVRLSIAAAGWHSVGMPTRTRPRLAQPKVAGPRRVYPTGGDEAQREGARLVLATGTSFLANLLVPMLLFYLQPVLLNQLLAWGLAGLVLLDGALALTLFALRRQALALGCG